jgi:hypothetical protein
MKLYHLATLATNWIERKSSSEEKQRLNYFSLVKNIKFLRKKIATFTKKKQ